MTYAETLEYLYTSQPAFHQLGAAAYKPGFANTELLMQHLGNPHMHLRAVHIAGTNGKGSTSHLIAAALQAAGYKVGLYTSPHLVDFRERIRINGEMISEERVVTFVEENKGFLSEVKPSFFETTMALAFAYFVEEQVDIAVIEVGLGGRLDSTNILPPYNPSTGYGVMTSVITNIGFDHTEFLGNTMAAIASEKAGIIKQGVPCVIGETDTETAPVFLNKAQECKIFCEGLETTGCNLWFADQCGYLRRLRERVAPTCELYGAYQEKNQQTAFVALIALQQSGIIRIPHTAIATGFAQVVTLTGLRGRWETLRERPLTICDTGHNAHGIRTYVEQLRQLHQGGTHNCSQDQAGNSHLRIVFGMVQDKDVDLVMTLLPKEAFYYWTQGQTHRAIPALQMRMKGLGHGLIGVAYDTVEQALHAAEAEASLEDIIFIGGSNYVVGEALAITKKQ